MKFFGRIIPLFILVSMFVSCNQFASDKQSLEYFVFKESKNDKYGFIKPDGTVLYPDEFENRPTCICDGIFLVYENNGYSVYNASASTPSLVNDLEGLASAGGYTEDRIPITRKDSRIEVIDGKGSTIFTLEPVNGKEIVSCNAQYTDGMLLFKTEDYKNGAVNLQGEVVVEPKYSMIFAFNEGYSLARKDINDVSTYCVINKTGEVVFKYKDEWTPETYLVQDGCIIVNNGDRIVFVDAKGEQTKCPSKVKGISWYDSERIIFKNESDYYGVMNRKDFEVIVRAKYNYCFALPWDKSKYLVKNDEKWQVIDEKGEIVINWKDDYEGIVVITSKGFEGFVGYEDDEYVFLNKKGEKIKFSTDIYYLDNNTLAESTVGTRYFNVNGFVNTLSDMIGSNSLDEINVNSTVNQYLPSSLSPSSVTMSYSFKPNGHTTEGFRYKIDAKIEARYTLAFYEYDYYYYLGEYRFRENNPIDYIYLYVDGPNDLWEKTKALLEKAMTKKGFTLSKQEDSKMIFTKGIVSVDLYSTSSGMTVKMYTTNSVME